MKIHRLLSMIALLCAVACGGNEAKDSETKDLSVVVTCCMLNNLNPAFQTCYENYPAQMCMRGGGDAFTAYQHKPSIKCAELSSCKKR